MYPVEEETYATCIDRDAEANFFERNGPLNSGSETSSRDYSKRSIGPPLVTASYEFLSAFPCFIFYIYSPYSFFLSRFSFSPSGKHRREIPLDYSIK